MASVEDLTKQQLLEVLEHCPQRFWPPRPTRQGKSELVRCVKRATYLASPEGDACRAVLAKAWAERRKKLTTRA